MAQNNQLSMVPILDERTDGARRAMNYMPGQAPHGRMGGGGMLGSVNSGAYSSIRPGARSMVFDQSFGGHGVNEINRNQGQSIGNANDYMNRNRGFRPTGGADEMSGVAVGRRPDMNPVERARLAGMGGSMPMSDRGRQLAAAVRGNGY